MKRRICFEICKTYEFCRKYKILTKKAVKRPVPTQSIQNVGGTQVGVIYGKTLLRVPIGTPNSSRHPAEGARPGCPCSDAGPHNFSLISRTRSD